MHFLTPNHDFTYAAPEDAAWRRGLIHAIEQATGKPRLWRLCSESCAGPASEDFFGEAVERLVLTVLLDGLVLGYLLSQVRPDFLIVIHAAPPQVSPVSLGGGDRDSRRAG